MAIRPTRALVSCPVCNNPGHEILPFAEVSAEYAIAPLFVIHPQAMFCPCGCIFTSDGIIERGESDNALIVAWWITE